MTRITTKKGDKGFTELWSKEIVSKSSDRIDTLGHIDELIALIGVCRCYAYHAHIQTNLKYIQQFLSKAAAEVIGTSDTSIQDLETVHLEQASGLLEGAIKYPTHWYFAGKNKSSSFLNYARTKTRACERKIVGLVNKNEITNEKLIVFFNRLSDYLYLAMLYEDQID